MANPVKLDYYPAQLFKGARWYIGFYVTDPSSGELVRKTIKWNRIKNLRDREREGKNVVRQINEKLAHGWNPFIEQESPKSFTLLHEAVGRFIRQAEKAHLDGSLRKDTIRTYRSYLKVFTEWVGPEYEKKFAIWLTRDRLNDFLDYVYFDRNTSPRTRNNHLSYWVTVGEWLLKKEYLKANPAAGIEKLKLGTKKRIIISGEHLSEIFDYLHREGSGFYPLCLTIYYTFIRRKELGMLKVKHVIFDKGTIYIPPHISKNKKGDVVTMPQELQKILAAHCQKAAPEHYLFSLDNFRAGPTAVPVKKISDTWRKLRKVLDLPLEYQFYSLKDTGITEMLRRGIPPIMVRDQARHHSLEQTDDYTPHETLEANPALKSYHR